MWTDHGDSSNLTRLQHSPCSIYKLYRTKMGVYIVGFICALILAAIVIGWIAYCMFIRERHKSESYQYNISDLQHKNYLLTLQQDDLVEKEVKAVTAGVLILPSRGKEKDEYEKRPDYPESPSPVSLSQDKLIEIINDAGVETISCYKDGIYEVDQAVKYHSDVCIV